MLRVVISDTSPLRYLILIGAADLLPTLYREIAQIARQTKQRTSDGMLQSGDQIR